MTKYVMQFMNYLPRHAFRECYDAFTSTKIPAHEQPAATQPNTPQQVAVSLESRLRSDLSRTGPGSPDAGGGARDRNYRTRRPADRERPCHREIPEKAQAG